MPRPAVCVFIATSLDGFIATEDNDLSWLEAAGSPDEDYGFQAFLASVNVVAMGRGTYDYIAGIDPLPYGELPVEVFTNRAPAPRPGVSFGSWTPAQAVQRWTAAGYQRVYLDGGNLISQFVAAGLVDELTVTVVPILLGAGRPLFHAVDRMTPLVLVGVTQFDSGMVQLTYRSQLPEQT
jgi:dihydrofolate reductase